MHIYLDFTRFCDVVIHLLVLAGLMKDGFTVLRKVFDAKECSLDPFRLSTVGDLGTLHRSETKGRGFHAGQWHDRRAKTNAYLFPSRPNQRFWGHVRWPSSKGFLGTSGDVAVDRIWDFAIGRCPALDPKDELWQQLGDGMEDCPCCILLHLACLVRHKVG